MRVMKSTKALAVLLSLALVLVLTGCPNDGTGGSGNSGGIFDSVIIAGKYKVSGLDYACYWKNGKKVDLATNNAFRAVDDDYYSETHGTVAVGSDIYIAGEFYYVSFDEDGNGYSTSTRACYWKNGDIEVLEHPDGYLEESITTSIVAVGTDVYIAGYMIRINENDYREWNACYWKNGTVTVLPVDKNEFDFTSPYFETIPIDMTVSGSDVYILGYLSYANDHDNVQEFCYWKNDELVIPEIDYEGSVLTAIAVSGADVYLLGYKYLPIDGMEKFSYIKSFYWKNGVKTEIVPPDSAHPSVHATDIAISGSDVYVTGSHSYDTTNSSGYGVFSYKNGVMTVFARAPGLPDGSQDWADSILIDGSDVYISGRYEDFDSEGQPTGGACYWLNGELHGLNTADSTATGIAIVED